MNKHELLEQLASLDIHPGKQLGQNFLIDGNLLDYIVRQADLKPGDRVLEVGPGLGVLTEHLVASGAEVVAVEFDHRLAEYLPNRFRDGNFRLISEDVCKVDLAQVFGPEVEFRCIANLPYAVSSVFIASLIELERPPTDMLFMLQKEMGQRLAAKARTKQYGSLTVRAQTCYDIELLRTVPPQVFYPQPDVDSAIVKFTRRPACPSTELREKLSRLAKGAFAQRRKMMHKPLAKVYGRDKVEAALAALEIPNTARAEELSVEQFLHLAEQLG